MSERTTKSPRPDIIDCLWASGAEYSDLNITDAMLRIARHLGRIADALESDAEWKIKIQD